MVNEAHLYSSFYLDSTKHITCHSHTHSDGGRAVMQASIGISSRLSVLLNDTLTSGSNYSNNCKTYNPLNHLSHSCPKESDMLFFM